MGTQDTESSMCLPFTCERSTAGQCFFAHQCEFCFATMCFRLFGRSHQTPLLLSALAKPSLIPADPSPGNSSRLVTAIRRPLKWCGTLPQKPAGHQLQAHNKQPSCAGSHGDTRAQHNLKPQRQFNSSCNTHCKQSTCGGLHTSPVPRGNSTF